MANELRQVQLQKFLHKSLEQAQWWDRWSRDRLTEEQIDMICLFVATFAAQPPKAEPARQAVLEMLTKIPNFDVELFYNPYRIWPPWDKEQRRYNDVLQIAYFLVVKAHLQFAHSSMRKKESRNRSIPMPTKDHIGFVIETVIREMRAKIPR